MERIRPSPSMPIVDENETDQSVDHFGRSTHPTPHAAPIEDDRGENSDPGETATNA